MNMVKGFFFFSVIYTPGFQSYGLKKKYLLYIY